MTIKIYPNKLEGEPLEQHSTDKPMTLLAWLNANVAGFVLHEEAQPISITMNGYRVDSAAWCSTVFAPTDDVRIYAEPKGAALIYAAIAIVAAVVTVLLMPGAKTPTAQQTSRKLEDAGAMANTVRYGEPVPEIAGSPVSFPDYLLPPRRYYTEMTQQWIEQFVCVGRGKYLKSLDKVYIGETSALSMGSDVQVSFYEPGETIPEQDRAWWHAPEEVGFTSFGGTGLTLGPEGDDVLDWGGLTSFSGRNITSTSKVPDGWDGAQVRVESAGSVIFGPSWVSSAALDGLGIQQFDEIEITGTYAGNYIVSSITPASGGAAGSAASVIGSSPPRLDYDVTPATFTVSIYYVATTVTLSTSIINISALVTAINSQLAGTKLQAFASGTELKITEIAPYSGGSITLSGDVSDLLGTPSYTAGSAPTGASDTRYYLSGAYFNPSAGTVSIGRSGLLFYATRVSDYTLQVVPVEYPSWGGFPTGVVADMSSVTLANAKGGWHGPFTAVPRGELASAFEVDIFFPAGLIRYKSNGHWRDQDATVVIQWRYLGGTEWNTRTETVWGKTPNQIGFTYRVDLPSPGRVEVRLRSEKAPSEDSKVQNKQQWSGLRSLLAGAPESYPDFTTAMVRLRTGDRVSGGAENKISIRATRILPTIEDPEVLEPTRDIAPWLVYMLGTAGYGRDLIDMDQLEALHSIWTGRGDTFDLAITASSTIKTVANSCLGAGFAELTLRRGKITPVRDAMPLGYPDRVFSPQEYMSPLIETTKTIMPDDVDGVDAEYVDYETGKTLTVEHRLPGDLGYRVKTIKVPGVTNRTKAWRIAARARRVLAYRRTTYKGSTEMQAMNVNYLDYVGLLDGIPEYSQSAFVTEVDGLVLTISESPTGVDTVAIFRADNGMATDPVDVVSIDGNKITLANTPKFAGEDFVPHTGHDNTDATVIYLANVGEHQHLALITSVKAKNNGNTEFEAVAMDSRVYDNDGSSPPTG